MAPTTDGGSQPARPLSWRTAGYGMFDACTLHIGLPKTGTTALQERFARHAGVLRRLGVFYYTGAGGPVPRHIIPLGCFFEAPEALLVNRSDGLDRTASLTRSREHLDRLVAQARASGCSRLVLSCEHLAFEPVYTSPLAFADLKAFLDSVARHTTVVAYVREPRRMAVSAEQQTIHNGLPEPIGHFPIRRALEPFLETWGRAALSVRPYPPPEPVDGDVVGDFLTHLGLTGDALPPAPTGDNAGRFDLEAGWIGRALNRRRPWLTDDGRRNPERASVTPALAGIRGRPFGLPASVLEAVARASEADVAWLKTTFGVAFDDDPGPEPAPEQEWSDTTLADVGEALNTLTRQRDAARAGREQEKRRADGLHRAVRAFLAGGGDPAGAPGEGDVVPPDDPATAAELIGLLLDTGHAGAAAGAAEAALDRAGRKPALLYALARVRLAQGRTREGLALKREAAAPPGI